MLWIHWFLQLKKQVDCDRHPSLDHFCPIKVRSNKIQLQKRRNPPAWFCLALRTCTSFFLSTCVCKPKDVVSSVASNMCVHVYSKLHPKDHWTLKTGYFEDRTLLYRFIHPSIGGSKILRAGKCTIRKHARLEPCILHHKFHPQQPCAKPWFARYRFRIRVECPSDACMKTDENRSGDRAAGEFPELPFKGNQLRFKGARVTIYP